MSFGMLDGSRSGIMSTMDMLKFRKKLARKLEQFKFSVVSEKTRFQMDEIIPLGVLYTLFNDILKRPDRFSMSDFIEGFFYRYCDMEVKGTPRNFLFRLEGKELLYQVNYDKALSYEGEVTLPNKALRHYLCNMFSGINTKLNMFPYRDTDFYFTFNGRELLVKAIEKVKVDD